MTTCEELYELFLSSKEGQYVWQCAYEIYPQYNTMGDDTYDAADYIVEHFETWLYNNEDLVQPRTVAAWIESNRDEFFESVFAGLT